MLLRPFASNLDSDSQSYACRRQLHVEFLGRLLMLLPGELCPLLSLVDRIFGRHPDGMLGSAHIMSCINMMSNHRIASDYQFLALLHSPTINVVIVTKLPPYEDIFRRGEVVVGTAPISESPCLSLRMHFQLLACFLDQFFLQLRPSCNPLLLQGSSQLVGVYTEMCGRME